MGRFVIVALALGALTLPAAAQSTKSALKSEEVYWVVTLTVEKIDQFKPVVAKLVAATEKEPGTLQYEYNVGADNKTVDICERYVNSKAAVAHVQNTFLPNFAKEFMELTKPVRFVVYGSPTDEFKNAMADFHPTYMAPLDGFTR